MTFPQYNFIFEWNSLYDFSFPLLLFNASFLLKQQPPNPFWESLVYILSLVVNINGVE